MRRLRLIAAGLAAAGVGAAALTPWRIEGAAALVGAQLARDYGLALAAGPATFTLAPVPRLAFADATLRDADGAVLAEAGRLSAALGLAGLLQGRAEVTEIAAEGARIVLPSALAGGLRPAALQRAAQAAGRAAAEGSHLRRLTLRDATVIRRARDGGETRAESVDLTLAWPRRGALEASGGLTWAGAPVRFDLTGPRPADLAAGQGSPAVLTLRWPDGRLDADGAVRLEPGRPWTEARWAGSARLGSRSVRGDLAWLKVPAALAPLVDGLDLEAQAEAGADGVVLSQVRAKVAGTVLDGAAGVAFADGRLALSGTLATDNLDLGPVLAPVAAALAGGEALDLAGATGGDLDLRLSAGRVGAGPLAFEDVAARLVVREGEVEALIGRASLSGGTLKGLLALSRATLGSWTLGTATPGTEVKLQGAFNRVDVGPLFAELGQPRWLQGRAGGQVVLEASGATPADLASGLSGRLTVGLDGGELAGVDLEEVLHGRQGRDERRGRTPFERADLALRFTDGVGEITEASLRASALLAGLRGRVSIPERSLGARAEVAPREGHARPALFDLSGPWARPQVASAPPDVPPPFPAPSLARGPVSGPSAKSLPARASAFAP
jgi:AsmA protein